MTITLILTLGIVAGLAAMAALLFRPMDASAHCDTMEGPAVQDGQLALETGNVNVALKWVHSDGGAELSRVFDPDQAARLLRSEERRGGKEWGRPCKNRW